VVTGKPEPQLLKAMEAEHTSKYGHDITFTSLNYNITTMPQQEWNLIINSKSTNGDGINNTKYGRRIPNVETLLSNDLSMKAQLTRVEVIALVLYTGPMVRRQSQQLVIPELCFFHNFKIFNPFWNSCFCMF
jgi:hypothetical protein